MERDLPRVFQASIDEHGLAVQRSQWRHGTCFTVRIQRFELPLGGQAKLSRACDSPKAVDINEGGSGHDGKHRLIICEAGNGLGPLSAWYMRDGSLLLRGVSRSMVQHGVRHVLITEEVFD